MMPKRSDSDIDKYVSKGARLQASLHRKQIRQGLTVGSSVVSECKESLYGVSPNETAVCANSSYSTRLQSVAPTSRSAVGEKRTWGRQDWPDRVENDLCQTTGR